MYIDRLLPTAAMENRTKYRPRVSFEGKLAGVVPFGLTICTIRIHNPIVVFCHRE